MSSLSRATRKTDDEIVTEFWARDQQAVTDTAERYGPYLYQICFRILRDSQSAKECVNDVYLKAWAAIPPNRPEKLASYLGRLARETSVDRVRRETRQKRIKSGLWESLDDYREILASEENVEQTVETRALSAALERYLGSLPVKERVLFVKRYYYACSYSEIAAETGIPRTTVHRLLSRIKTDLKDFLTKEGYLP